MSPLRVNSTVMYKSGRVGIVVAVVPPMHNPLVELRKTGCRACVKISKIEGEFSPVREDWSFIVRVSSGARVRLVWSKLKHLRKVE